MIKKGLAAFIIYFVCLIHIHNSAAKPTDMLLHHKYSNYK